MDQKNEFKDFFLLCNSVKSYFDKEWREAAEPEKEKILEHEKQAIMGYPQAVDFYKDRISGIIERINVSPKIIQPPWYNDLKDGIFAELYGLSGLDPWAYDKTEAYRESSSAKLIGDRLYCLIDGKSELQPQRIDAGRREQLKRALLMATPRERIEKGFHEVYLNNGIRITIYSGNRTKEGEDIMIFRKYILRELTFEKMASLGTIPAEAVELFKVMVKLGFNTLFTGPVRSGKTTFMQTWQRYEDPDLEGLAIATDPETPWQVLMPQAPIMQLVADGADLESIFKSLLRGDNDYVILEEMRDAAAYKLAMDITSSGTIRSKATIHAGDPQDIPFKMASGIASAYGGSLEGIISQFFRNFNYVFEFCQLPEDKSKKRLRSIHEYRYDVVNDRTSIHCICKYDEEKGKWLWKCDIGEDKRKMGKIWPEEFKKMENMLALLEKHNPLMENTVVYPRYYKGDKVRVNDR